MISFKLLFHSREHGAWASYVATPEWWADYDSIDIVDDVSQRIIARIEKGQIADLGARIEHLIGLLEKGRG